MKTLRANRINLAYDSFGDAGAEVILLIAGLGTQMIRWAVPFCQSLAGRGYRVIRFDNRDAGCSTHFFQNGAVDFATLVSKLMAGQRPDVPYTLDDMADDSIGLLDALSVNQAHVVGRSMGGMIAQILASEHSERILSLTSIMSSTGNSNLPPTAPDVMAMMTRSAPDPTVDETGFVAHNIAFARRIAGTGHPFDEESYRALVMEEVRRCYDAAGSSRQLAAMAVAGDRRSCLQTISVPTLVIHGADDVLIPPAHGEDTAASIPGAKFMLIEGMGHDLPSALHGTVAEAIDQIASVASNQTPSSTMSESTVTPNCV